MYEARVTSDALMGMQHAHSSSDEIEIGEIWQRCRDVALIDEAVKPSA